MQVFLGLAFLIVIGVTIFAVQNSSAPPVVMKFLAWKFETSLVYTLLGSIGAGMLIIFLLWIRSAIRAALRIKSLKKEIDVLEREMKHQIAADQPKEL